MHCFDSFIMKRGTCGGPDLRCTLLQRWYQTVVKLRASLSAWTQKQSKHAAVAYPLITCLVCLEDDDTFANDVDPLVDNLHRIFKASLVACRVKSHNFTCDRANPS